MTGEKVRKLRDMIENARDNGEPSVEIDLWDLEELLDTLDRYNDELTYWSNR